MATGNFIRPISAAQGALYYDTAAGSIDFSSALSSLFSADEQVIACKDVSITPPKTESSQVALLGVESTTAGSGVLNTGTFQNAIQDFKNTTNAEFSATLILTLANDGDSPTIPDFLDLASGTGEAISTTHHRHSMGNSASNQAQVLTGVVFLAFDDGTVAGVAALVNPTINWDEIKPTGADGHWEVSVSGNTLPKNFAIEVEDLD